MPKPILFSVVKMPSADAYGVIENATGKFLPATYYFNSAKAGEELQAKLMAGAYATGFADCKFPNR